MSNLITAIVDWTSATSDASDAVFKSTDVLELCRRVVRPSCTSGCWQLDAPEPIQFVVSILTRQAVMDTLDCGLM
jgi:hypothetical protein